MLPDATKAVQVLRSFLGQEKSSAEGRGLWSQFATQIQSLSLIDLNYILYRCDSEEKDDGNGGGVYVIPDIGSMTYCGVQVFG